MEDTTDIKPPEDSPSGRTACYADLVAAVDRLFWAWDYNGDRLVGHVYQAKNDLKKVMIRARTEVFARNEAAVILLDAVRALLEGGECSCVERGFTESEKGCEICQGRHAIGFAETCFEAVERRRANADRIPG